MKRFISITLAAVSLVSLQACENLTPDQRTVVGLTGGAAAGLITADILNADRDWRVIAALAGAATGVLVAQNDAEWIDVHDFVWHRSARFNRHNALALAGVFV
mgnify:CR=1 FL=1